MANSIDFTIHYFDEVSSTNTLAREYAEQGASEGLVLVAEYQTEGRGKPGRKWISPAGKNLLFSLLLRPSIAPSRSPIITQIACRSVAAILKEHGIESTFKRPNDILVNGKKICGILVESSTAGERLDYVVIGIGLNVNAEQEELIPEATSMKIISGRLHNKEELLQKILRQFQFDTEELYAHSF